MTASASVRKGNGCIILAINTSAEALQGSTYWQELRADQYHYAQLVVRRTDQRSFATLQ